MSRHSVTFSPETDSGATQGSEASGSEEDSSESSPFKNDGAPSHPRRLNRSFSLVPERLGMGSLPGGALTREEKHLANCEIIIHALAVTLVVLFFPVSLIWCLKVVAQYERAVIFRLGRIGQGGRGPGLIFILPCLDSIKRIDLRTFTFDVPTQEVLTKDSVTVAVDAVVYYRIFDPVMSVVNVEDSNRSTKLLAQTTLRNVLGTIDLYQLLTEREDIAFMMQATLDAATDTWGVKVERVEVKDVRLPVQMQRAMAAEAEAAREARAKVIAAEGEHKASGALRAAAQELSKCHLALQLRYLQTLNNIASEKNSTIIFPLPLEMLKYFDGEHCDMHVPFVGSEKPPPNMHPRGGLYHSPPPPPPPPHQRCNRPVSVQGDLLSTHSDSEDSPDSETDTVHVSVT